MSHPTIEEQLRTLLARQLGQAPAAIDLGASWRTLGLDSLDLLALVLDCEQLFDVTIPDDQLLQICSVLDLAAWLSTHQPG